MKNITAIAATLMVLLSGTASAGCEGKFFNGALPVVKNKNIEKSSVFICYKAYGLLTSGATRTGIYSAEVLTRESVTAARGLKRENAFHAEDSLPHDMRAELNDYARSGFDRGHLTPSGDAGTQEAQEETFSLANMIPQVPENNRGVWEGIESATRHMAQEKGKVYVITGPLFEADNLQRLHNRVYVPTSIFKIVFDPTVGAGAAYVTVNGPGHNYKVVSIAEIEQRAGVNFFPTLPAATKSKVIQLPEPQEHGFAGRQGNKISSNTMGTYKAMNTALKMLRHF